MTLTGINRTTYRLDPTPIGSGGEGDIYSVLGMDYVAKIYKTGALSRELEEKLKIMIEHPPNASVLSQVAWPLDMAYDASSQCCGFIMPKLSINAELGEIYKYPSTLPISAQQKINIAQNICVVISEVHRAGYVFGDFNPRNIGLDINTGLVSFLDTDTYHVIDPIKRSTYRCNVCAPGYAAPELLEKCSDYVASNPSASKNAYAQTPLPTFTQETDNFALAIHIFKLLMNGYTPFGGIIETASVSQSSPGVGDAAVRRDSYCFKPGFKHQSAAILPLEALSQEIADLFTRAFIIGKINPHQRPSAAEWHGALVRYEQSLVTCSQNHLHQYDTKNDMCPLCEADMRYQDIVTGSATKNSLSQALYASPAKVAQAQTVAMPSPIVTASISQSKNTSTLAPNPRSKQRIKPALFIVTSLLVLATIVHFILPNGLIGLMVRTPNFAPTFEVVDRAMMTIAASGGFGGTSFAIQPDGSLWAWGNNERGLVGDGTFSWLDEEPNVWINNTRYTPVRIMEDVIAVSAGDSHAMAIREDNSLWAWGENRWGQLGNGTTASWREPVASPIRIMEDVVSVSVGGAHTMAIRSDGSLWAWGANMSGQLGNGTVTEVEMDEDTWEPIFEPISSPIWIMDNVVATSAGASHTMAIRTDGTLWAWGSNTFGQLGNGTRTITEWDEHGEQINIVDNDRHTPVFIMDDVIAVSAGVHHTMAIRSDGSLWAWGAGLLGDGSDLGRNLYEVWNNFGAGDLHTINEPTRIMDDVIAVSTGSFHTAIIRNDGSLWSWGNNHFGQIGDGARTITVSEWVDDLGWAEAIIEDNDRHFPVKIMDDVIAVSAGGMHTLATKADGSLWAWGENRTGQIGDGTATSGNVPVQTMDDVIYVSAGNMHTMAIRNDNSLWALGGSETRRTPIKVMDDVISVSAYNHTLAIRTDGSLWTWSGNWQGWQGGETDWDNPIWVMDNVDAVSVGSNHTMIIRTDGSLWTWSGGDVWGENEIDWGNPIWLMDNIIAVSAGGTAMAIRADNSLWALNRNWLEAEHDELFNITRIMDDVAYVSSQRNVMAISMDGSLWAWQDGEADWDNPIRVMDDVAAVSVGDRHTMALRNDNSLWTWGSNDDGLLGNITEIGWSFHTDDPIRVLEGVVNISAGGVHSTAIRTDGNLWAWGRNHEGQLGDGMFRNSPVRVMDFVMIPSH